jgi:hypothetical protein
MGRTWWWVIGGIVAFALYVVVQRNRYRFTQNDSPMPLTWLQSFKQLFLGANYRQIRSAPSVAIVNPTVKL